MYNSPSWRQRRLGSGVRRGRRAWRGDRDRRITGDRQDIHYELAARALEKGCMFALDSDAHANPELAFSRHRHRARAARRHSRGPHHQLLAGEEAGEVDEGAKATASIVICDLRFAMTLAF